MRAPLTLPERCDATGPFSCLLLRPVKPGALWRVEAPFTYWLPDDEPILDKAEPHEWMTLSLDKVVVPPGFLTDLDSVPRLPFVYWVGKSRTVKAAVVHDWLYATAALQPGDRRRVSRAQADRIFWCAMRDEGVPGWQRGLIYAAVRLAGGIGWRRARQGQ